ncbi:hypothetical protein MGSAQ_000774 [marine sediment metagenome]|uniref:Uncharacterized protein n=1 Tax=marine sediment metagenome TaxID=412755 RepID=A0A1B6NWD1_9ZZZZ
MTIGLVFRLHAAVRIKDGFPFYKLILQSAQSLLRVGYSEPCLKNIMMTA